MARIYYQNAVGAIVMFDLTQATSLDVAVAWKSDIDSKVFTSDGKPIPCLLVGNKVDLCQSGIELRTDKEMKQMVTDLRFIGFIKASARERTNVDEAVLKLVTYIHKNNIEPHVVPESITITPADKKTGQKCCE
jgi:GTPase SAR1 family protein